MTGEEFQSKWRSIGPDHYTATVPESIKQHLGSAAQDFLFISGMPSDVYDFSFTEFKEGPLKTVNEKWGQFGDGLENHLLLGHNGMADPVGLDLNSNELVYFNHDNHFERCFINSDLKCFALCALAVIDFNQTFTKINEDVIFPTEFADDNYEQTKGRLIQIDPAIKDKESSYWPELMEAFL